MSESFLRSLRFAPPALIIALVSMSIFQDLPPLNLGTVSTSALLADPDLIGAIFALAASACTKNILVVLMSGITAYLVTGLLA